jgi:hypothetical protein
MAVTAAGSEPSLMEFTAADSESSLMAFTVAESELSLMAFTEAAVEFYLISAFRFTAMLIKIFSTFQRPVNQYR